jgi:KDO2-lipid IV(A) lauroyltransferase
MKKLLNLFLTFILLILTSISTILSVKSRAKFGILIGKTIYFLSKSRREITRDNLRKAFPEKDTNWINTICKKSFENLGITFAELFGMYRQPIAKIGKNFKFKNFDDLKEVINRNKGLIILTGHFGNWELAAFALGQSISLPITIIVKPQSNNYADIFLNKIRTRGGNRIVSMYHSAFEMVKCIQNKEAVALIADQSATPDKDIFIDFFGRPAATYKAPAQLALKFDVPVVIGFSIRQKDFSYISELYEIDHSDLKNDEEGVKELTYRHVKLLEDFIRKYPDHWVWQHKRWKHQPKLKSDIN